MPKPILISFYGHKGGVGKTTTVHEFACVLAKELGYRVLIIDADSQCDLTRSLMRQTFINLAKDAKLQYRSDDDAVELGLDLYQQQKANPAQCKTFGESILPLLKLTKNIDDQVRNTTLYQAKEFGELYLLPGNEVDINNDVEDIVNQAVLSSEKFLPPYRKIPAIPQAFIRSLAQQHNIDLVLIDLNPASSRLNQVLLMGSDYYIMPVLTEYRSRRAVLTFSKILQNWDKSLEAFRTDELQMPDAPYFLGYLYQRVKIINYETEALPNAYKGEIEATRDAFRDVFMKSARIRDNFVLPPAPFIPEGNSFSIASVGAGLPFSYSNADEFNYTALDRSRVAKKAFSYRDRYLYYINGIFSNMIDEDLQSIQYDSKFKVKSLVQAQTVEKSPEKSSRKRTRAMMAEPQVLTVTNLQTHESLNFQAVPNRGDGDCGFLSLDIRRQTLVNTLLRQADNLEARRTLQQEIEEAVVTNSHFLGQELQSTYTKLNEIRFTAHGNRDEVRRALRERFPNAPQEEDGSRRMIDWLFVNKHNEEAQQLMLREEATIAEDNRVRRFLETSEVYKKYVASLLIEGTWMGCFSALLYARANNIPLRIWRRVGNTSNLELYRSVPDPFVGNDPIDLLYINSMHFERLRSQPASRVEFTQAEEAHRPEKRQRQRASSLSSFFEEEAEKASTQQTGRVAYSSKKH